MGTFPISFLFCIVLLLPHPTRTTTPVCEKRYCTIPEKGIISIEFPFQLKGVDYNQSDRCGYRGFEVFCNAKGQALLTLPNSGKFVITGISLQSQTVWINDPKNCLPRRFLNTINLTGSPFKSDTLRDSINLIFLNCSNNAEDLSDLFHLVRDIPCLGNGNHEFSIVSTIPRLPDSLKRVPTCRVIGNALVPVGRNSQTIWEDLYSDIKLQWNIPNCTYCRADQHCGFSTDVNLDVTCYDNHNSPSQGGMTPSTRSINYTPLGLGISGCLCIICITLLSTRKVNTDGGQPQTSIEIEPNIGSPPPLVSTVAEGLDGSVIEQYPKIQLGESGRLPNSIDNVCSICLCEYEPKQTLRTMPQCNHYFHAHCVDPWLKINATCPLCRNLPMRPSLVTSSLPPSTTPYHSSS